MNKASITTKKIIKKPVAVKKIVAKRPTANKKVTKKSVTKPNILKNKFVLLTGIIFIITLVSIVILVGQTNTNVAINNSDKGSDSKVLGSTARLQYPSDFSVSKNIGEMKVTLRWKNNSERGLLLGHYIFCNGCNNWKYKKAGTTGGGETETFTLGVSEGIKADRNYEFYVGGYYAPRGYELEGLYSNKISWSISIPNAIKNNPGSYGSLAPKNVSYTSNSNTIALNWKERTADWLLNRCYNVKRWNNTSQELDNDPSNLADNVSDNKYVDTNLSRNTTYYYVIVTGRYTKDGYCYDYAKKVNNVQSYGRFDNQDIFSSSRVTAVIAAKTQ